VSARVVTPDPWRSKMKRGHGAVRSSRQERPRQRAAGFDTGGRLRGALVGHRDALGHDRVVLVVSVVPVSVAGGSRPGGQAVGVDRQGHGPGDEALLGLVGARHADVEALTKDQIAKTSSSNATTTRRFADASTPSS
jgi:hypothetical protein